jgi:hypothetical protein
MSNNRDFTITTLRNSVKQHGSASLRGTVVANNQVPFSFSPYSARIRDSGVPYVTGPDTATDLNLRRNVPTASSGGGGGGASYISPWLYLEFETSSSTVVAGNKGTYSALTGTLFNAPSKIAPRYVTSSPYSGSRSLEFYDGSTSATANGFLNFGTPNENPQWSMITGSFTFAFWYYPNGLAQYNSLFHHKTLTSTGGYEWMIVVGDNTGSDGPIGFYDGGGGTWNYYPAQNASGALHVNQWNHIVVTVSGTVASDARRFRAYINGTDLGIYTSRVFPNEYDATKQIFFGQWYYNAGTTYTLRGKIDEVSIWDFDVSPGQAAALYNGGSGVNAMRALTQSS